MSKPLISIILPTYNGEKYIRETIESALSQTFHDFELIIVDDGSSDKSPEIINEYADHPNINAYIYEENVGQSRNWNRGIKKASGRFIKLLGQDDKLTPYCLEESIKVFEQNKNISLLTSYRELFEDLKERRGENYFFQSGLIEGLTAQKRYLKYGNWIGGPTAVMFRRTDFEKVDLFNETLDCSFDIEMWLRLLSMGDLYVVPKVLFKTRVHSYQETNNCIRKLGFERERIQIFYLIQKEPNYYGQLVSFVTDEILQKSIYRLLKKVLNSKDVRYWEAFSYSRKFASLPIILRMSGRIFFYRILKKMKLYK